VATLLACAMFATKTVTVKLLPFDNKSELQVVLDLPEGTSLEATQRVLIDAALVTRSLPEVVAIDAYAGTASPFNFNGLVRHYYLRNKPEMGDLSVALAPKDDRQRSSHAIALDLRRGFPGSRCRRAASIKVVEAPPGPPVMATLLAEVYGPDARTRRAVAERVKADLPVRALYRRHRRQLRPAAPGPAPGPDRDRLEALRVSDRDVYDSIGAALGGQVVGYAHRGEGRDPLEISVRLPQSARSWGEGLAAMPVAQSQGDGWRTAGRTGRSRDNARTSRLDPSSAATAATST
jgi:multidrug efflux pump subunit AcrB